MKIKYIILTFLFLCVALIITHKTAHAASPDTIPYLVTTPFVMPAHNVGEHPRPEIGRKDIGINYRAGRVMISSNEDGTGSIDVGDGIEIDVLQNDNNSTKTSFYYYPNGVFCYEYKSRPSTIPPLDITHLLGKGLNNVHINIVNFCSYEKNISQIYLVNQNATPVGPTPFLDLPWDYKGNGLSFRAAALNMTSYFDHEYPLLSVNNVLQEPLNDKNDLLNYRNEKDPRFNYSSHDGYDYSKLAKVNLGDNVLAAADGEATYVNNCSACGNMILIDHGNGYQTRYMHLQNEGLITSTPGQKVAVKSRQVIGKVGFTGNVSPKDQGGAHIHFEVVQDKNGDGNFQDNIPDGITDPFGWQSFQPDPWENYSFSYNGQQRTGNKSYYLWKDSLGQQKQTLSPAGGTYYLDNYTINIPKDTVHQDSILSIEPAPFAQINNETESITPPLLITLKDALGNAITQFIQSVNISLSFKSVDTTRYQPNIMSIYSSTDGVTWKEEQTTIDWQNKTATTNVNHFTYFALMAKRKDILAPTTTQQLSGLQDTNNTFTSDVQLALQPSDNENGSGVDYTLYKTQDTDWTTYTQPLNFTTEGHYKVDFYSADKDGNIEEGKSIEFDIEKDNLPPITTATMTGTKGQNDIFISDTQVSLNAIDEEGGSGFDSTFYKTQTSEWTEYSDTIIFTTDGQYKIDFYSVDKKGNKEENKSIYFTIDTTPPEARIYVDPDKQDLVVDGIDRSTTVVTKVDNVNTKKKDDALYYIKDEAGNTLELDIRDRDKDKKDVFKIYSLKYGDNPPLTEPNNHYNVSYQNKKGKANVLEQNFAIRDEVKIRIQYNSKKDQSTIITKEMSNERVKEIKSGLILLQLKTNKGTIEYGY